MNKLVYLIASLLLITSCKSPYDIKVSAGHDASEPNKGNFIKMKSGREVKLSDEIDVKSGNMEIDKTRMIKIDNKKYKGADVAAVQLNGDYYMNGARNSFARRIYRGYFDVYTHTTTSTTSSYNSSTGSFSSPRTTYKTEYFLQSPKISSGAFTKLNYGGNAKELEPFLKTYKPSMDILKKYQEQRKISRIVKFSVAGLWVSSIALAANTNSGTTFNNVALGSAVAGLFYVPAFTMFFKARNHRRPVKAVQTFIDNNFDEVQTANVNRVIEKSDATPKEQERDTLTSNTSVDINNADVKSIQSDFIELNNKELILANEGTKLKSANNKIFMLNGQKYTNGVTAFQINKKYFKHFPDMSEQEDFAQRSVTGKISAFNVIKGTNQNYGNLNSQNMFVGKKNTYFTKEGVDGFIKKRQALHSYFEDNAKAFAMYNDYSMHYKKFKTTYFSLLGVTTASLVGALTMVFTRSNSTKSLTPVYILSGVTVVSSWGNYFYVKSKVPKLNKEFIGALDAYNGTKKAKAKKR